MSQRVGDWRCLQCSFNNFASNSKCKNCDAFKSKSVKPAKKAGDWDCSCGHSNLASRNACHKCLKSKSVTIPQSSAPNNLQDLRPGDWFCENEECKMKNFGNRSVCFGCGKSKVTGEQKEDETCTICMDRSIDTVIKSCGHLAYCFLCASNMNKCPHCRIEYNPDIDILKVYRM